MCQRTPFHALPGLLLSVVLASSALAQGVTGGVKGQIIDVSKNGVASIAVTLTDNHTGRTRTVTTNADGRFRLQLTPGEFTLQLSAGYASVTIEKVVVNLGAVVELTIPVDVIDEIVVKGVAADFMGMSTGETGLQISMDELAQLPVPRSIESVGLMAPDAVAGDNAFGEDKTLVSFGGASVAENAYYIDGFNVTDFRSGLGGSSVPFEFYDQFQIKTGGYSAEFGRSTGGVLNAVTKRGGNEFSYGVVTYYEPESLHGQSPDTMRPDGSYYDLNSENSQSRWTTDLYASGPIIKDRLFFFALYEPQSSSEEIVWRNSTNRLSKVEMEDDFWGGNLTWNITDNHSLSYTAFSDERGIVEEIFDYDVDDKEAGGSRGESTGFRGGDSHILNYEGQLSDKLVVSALYGKNEYDLTDQSPNDVTCPSIYDIRDSSTAAFPGCWANFEPEISFDKREAYRLDLKYFFGNHELRAGLDREESISFKALTKSGFDFAPDQVGGIYYRYQSFDVGYELANGGIVPDVNGDGSRVDLVRFEYMEEGGTFETSSTAWYIEDTWTINDAFTVSLGVRNEVFENFNGVGDPFFKIDGQWAPRFAFSWSPGGSGNQRVLLNWGRYHLPIRALPNIYFGGAWLDPIRYFVFDGERDLLTAAPIAIDSNGVPTTQEIGSIWYRGDGTVPDTRSVLDASLEPMYQDEWIVAYERGFGDDWVAGIRYVRRELKSLIEDVSTLAWSEAIGFTDYFSDTFGCWFVMTNPGTNVTTFCDLDGDGALEETVMLADDLGYPKAKRTYEAVEFTVEKSFGNKWALQGSYTWSKNKGNTEGSVKSDNGQGAANLTEDFDVPQTMDGAYGYLPNDRRHKLKFWASYEATDDLMFSAYLFAQSGRPINSFGTGHPGGTPWYGATYYLQQPDGSFEFTPRGTAGRTDWITQLNLSAIYSFAWGDSANIELRAEVFNLFDSDSVDEVYEYPEEQADLFKLPMSYQQPRYLRFGAAVRF